MKKIINLTEVCPYTYQDKREEMAPYFEPLFAKMLAAVPSQENPKLVHMLGIPAAGKSTYYQQHKQDYVDYLFIGFDYIMQALPQYQQDLKILGSVKAFEKWQIFARVAGYELLFRGVEQRKNIFFDHTGHPACHVELVRKMCELGYKTKVIFIPCSVETAQKRAVTRELVTKRHTPPEMISERYVLIQQRVPQYEAICDEFVVKIA